MEQRKLIQHGLSSLTLSLPSKWLKERKLKKGDSLFIEQESNKLIVSTKKSLSMDKISVDVSKLDRTSLILYIQSLYRFGYNEIEVKTTTSRPFHYRANKDVSFSKVVNKIVNRLIGAEVIEQEKNRVLIKHLAKEETDDFRIILRRAILLMVETGENLLEGIKNNDLNLISTIEESHDNVNKFVNYCLRLLNKYGYPDVKKTCFYYHIIASVDKILDILKYNARDILKYKKKFNKETIQVWEQLNKSIRMYYQFFYKFSLEQVNDLSRNRDHVKNLIVKKMKKLPNEELIMLNNMKQILELILDLTDFRMGLEY